MQRRRLLKLIRTKRKIIWSLLSIFTLKFCLSLAYSSNSEGCFKTELDSAASTTSFLIESTLGKCEHVLGELTGYCAKSFKVKDFAIAVHLGDRTNSLRQGGVIYDVLEKVGTNALVGKVDVYVNIRRISQLKEIKLFDIWKKCKNLRPIYTLQRNNAGMDIGGFFNSMLAISQRCRIYKLILKLHSKEDQNWLRNAVHPLVGTSDAVATLLHTFLNESNKIGIVAGLPTHPFNCSVNLADRLFFGYALGDIDHLSSTMPHEDEILERFGAWVPRHKRMFHAGSMFGINGVMLSEVLPAEKIKKVLFELNDPNTLDLNWFRIMARITGDSISVKQSYYRFNTWKRQTPGNGIAAHHQRGILADGQVEHAWERIFFYLPFLSGRSIALQYLDQKQNLVNMILPKDMDLSSMGETKCFHSTFHYEECRKSSNLTAMCFLYANYGECLLRPSYMHQNCEDICSCARIRSADPFHHHKVQLAFITKMRSAGPFDSVSSKYANIFQCILHRKKHHTLAFPPIGDEIYFSSKMHIPGCARLETMNSKFQALIDERGFLYIYNFQAELLWSTEISNRSHFLKWFRNHLLTLFQFKRRLSNSICFVLHGNKEGLHISNLSLDQVLQCYSHWCSHPFILTTEGTSVLKLDDNGCLTLRSNFSSMLEQQLWSSCPLAEISH